LSGMRLNRNVAVEFPNWAQIKKRRRAHVVRVAAVIDAWADAMAVSDRERARWQRAVALHDALKDAPDDLLTRLAPDSWGVPALRHGPAAAARAAQDGESDREILDAVHFHSVGYRGWDSVGHVLFLADYLEPGRPYHTPQHNDLLRRVPGDISSVLLEVAAERIAGAVLSGRPLIEETVEFWNGLVRE